jgi:hypothetical protein
MLMDDCAEKVIEFSGTLVGFDDYVSEYYSPSSPLSKLIIGIDMVLEDVTELYEQNLHYCISGTG